MTVARNLRAEIAAGLPDNVRDALRNAHFNGYGWAVIAPSDEIAESLVTLKLTRFVRGQMIITIFGMGVRAVIACTSPSS